MAVAAHPFLGEEDRAPCRALGGQRDGDEHRSGDGQRHQCRGDVEGTAHAAKADAAGECRRVVVGLT